MGKLQVRLLILQMDASLSVHDIISSNFIYHTSRQEITLVY